MMKLVPFRLLCAVLQLVLTPLMPMDVRPSCNRNCLDDSRRLNRGMSQIFLDEANIVVCVCLVGGDRHATFGPRDRPNSHDTPLPRTTAVKVCPSRCSITGFHGTRLKLTPSSSMAKRPLASCTLRR